LRYSAQVPFSLLSSLHASCLDGPDPKWITRLLVVARDCHERVLSQPEFLEL
jgi:hypothetical protein